jgi:hypothetical protein
MFPKQRGLWWAIAHMGLGKSGFKSEVVGGGVLPRAGKTLEVALYLENTWGIALPK